MRKIRDLSEVLDKCIEHLLAGKENIDRSLDNCPKQRAELEPLIGLASDIRRVSMVMPSANFKERTRDQFCLALAEIKPKRKTWNLRFRLQLSIATALLVVLAFCVVGISTYHSMPGHLFHPVRHAFEELWLIQTPIGVAKAEKHALLVDRRVTEIIYLIKNGYKLAKLEQVTRQLYYHLAAIESLVATEIVMMKYHKVTVEAVTNEEHSDKTGLPDETMTKEPNAKQSELHATTVNQRGYLLFAAEKKAQFLQLKTTLKQQADIHLIELHELLQLIPESARSDLLTPISIVEAGYMRIIEVLETSLKTDNPSGD